MTVEPGVLQAEDAIFKLLGFMGTTEPRELIERLKREEGITEADTREAIWRLISQRMVILTSKRKLELAPIGGDAAH